VQLFDNQTKAVVFGLNELSQIEISALIDLITHQKTPNAAVQRPRDQMSSATHVHNEMAHVRRARADVSRSAATAC